MKAAILLWAAALSAQSRDVYFDGNNFLRPDAHADFQVDDHAVRLRRGVFIYHLADSGAPPVEFTTPSVSVQPYFVGEYRIEVTRSGESVIAPWGGDVRVVAPRGSQWISPGQKMIARGSPADPEFRIVSAVSRWRRLAVLASALARISMSSGGSAGPGEDNQPQDSGKSAPASKQEGAARNPEARSHDTPARSTAAPSSRGK